MARFRSLRVEPLDARRARIHGELTLRGTTRTVVLEATRNGERRHPLPPFRHTAGFSATATLSRADFGSTAWGSVIGDAVWACHRFALSFGGVEDLLASRGIRFSCGPCGTGSRALARNLPPGSVASAPARRTNGISTKS